MPDQAFEIPGFKYSLEAAADLSAGQFHGLVVNSGGNAARAGAGASIDGVQQNKPAAAGRATEIMQTGITKGVAGAAVLKGAALTMDATGRFVTATTGDFVSGVAMTAAGAADEIIAVLLKSLDVSA